MKRIISYGLTGICIGILCGLSSGEIASQLITSIFGLIIGTIEVYKAILTVKNKQVDSINKTLESSLVPLIIGVTIGVFIGIELKFWEYQRHRDDLNCKHTNEVCDSTSKMPKQYPNVFQSGNKFECSLDEIDTGDIAGILECFLSSENPFMKSIASKQDTLALQSFIIGYKTKK
ncbi:MAG: hypothetical protein ACO1G9_13535 [Bacteroidota bacterium]